MKKTVKKLIATIGIIILATPLVSCGEGDKKVPEEVVKTYVGTYLKSKDVDYKKTEVDKDSLEGLANKRDYNLAVIFNCDEENNDNEFLKALYTSLSKVEYNVISSDVKKDSAKVTLEIKGIQLDSVKDNAYKAMKEEKSKKKMNVDESMEYYKKSLIDGLNNIKLDENKTIDLELSKNSKKVWELTDDSITNLESAITEKDSYDRITNEIPTSFQEAINQAS